MEPITLALAAYTMAKPFLAKTGEGIARKVGEDIWNLIKSPFTKSGDKNIEVAALENFQEFQSKLEHFVKNQPDFAAELSALVEKSKATLSGNSQQNVNSFGEVGRQINIQQNSGNITM